MIAPAAKLSWSPTESTVEVIAAHRIMFVVEEIAVWIDAETTVYPVVVTAGNSTAVVFETVDGEPEVGFGHDAEGAFWRAYDEPDTSVPSAESDAVAVCRPTYGVITVLVNIVVALPMQSLRISTSNASDLLNGNHPLLGFEVDLRYG